MIKTAIQNVRMSSLEQAWPELRRFDSLKVDGYVKRTQIKARVDKTRGFVIDLPTPPTVQDVVASSWNQGEPVQALLAANAGEDYKSELERTIARSEQSFLPVLASAARPVALPPVISFDVTEHCAKQLSRGCSFDSYADFSREINRAPDLAAARFNRWFQDGDIYNSSRKREEQIAHVNHFVRTFVSDARLLQESESPWIMRALLSNAYKCIDTTDILSVLFTLLQQEREKFPVGQVDVEVSFDDAKCWFTVTNRKLQRATKRGDVIAASLRGGTSDVGTGSASVETRAVVLACTNGMTTGRSISMRHLGRRENDVPDGFFSEQTQRAQHATLLLELRDAMNAAFDEVAFKNVIDDMERNQDTLVSSEEAQPVFEAITRKIGVAESVKDALFAQFMGERHQDGSANQSKDGLVQSITAIGRNLAEVDYNKAIPFEDVGGALHRMPIPAFRKLISAASEDARRAAKLL